MILFSALLHANADLRKAILKSKYLEYPSLMMAEFAGLIDWEPAFWNFISSRFLALCRGSDVAAWVSKQGPPEGRFGQFTLCKYYFPVRKLHLHKHRNPKMAREDAGGCVQ